MLGSDHATLYVYIYIYIYIHIYIYTYIHTYIQRMFTFHVSILGKKLHVTLS